MQKEVQSYQNWQMTLKEGEMWLRMMETVRVYLR